MTDIYTEIKKEMAEFKEKTERDLFSQKQKAAFEQRIFKRLIEERSICAKCPRTEYLTLDHIVPRSILFDFGVDADREIVFDNYQILCKTCNTFKSDRLDFSVPQTKIVLLRLLEKL